MICSNWATPTDLVNCDCPDDAPKAVVDDSLTAASEILYALTGRQYPGMCEDTLRPCSNPGSPAGWAPSLWSYPWTPLRVGGMWVNVGPCGCAMDSCGCAPYPRLNLGRADIADVTGVTINGSDFADYMLYDRQYLVRTDGGRWPCCQDLTRPDSEEGTWSVTVVYGNPVPVSLVRAAAVLASELIKGCTGGECRLPPRTLSVVKQGVNIQVSGVLQELEAGLTGITEVDLAIRAFNPNGLSRPPRVWSPESTRLLHEPSGT